MERLTVAVDGGPASEAAGDWVVERAKTVQLQLTVTTVADLDWVDPGDAEARVREMYAQILETAAGRLEERTTLHATRILRSGDPARALISASRRADVLVIGSNKTGPVTGMIHGTVPLRVAGRAECPTVVVPAGWGRRGTGVVVGWNDDGAGDAVLDFAAREARRRQCSLTVLHAWSVPMGFGLGPMGPDSLLDGVVDAHRRGLALACAKVRTEHPQLVVEENLHSGPAAGALVEAARQAELVVVGSHARGVIGGLILGSVSHDVLMNMPAVVAVVPYPEEPIVVLPEIADEALI